MGLIKEEQQVRIPHIHIPSSGSSKAFIEIDDLVRILRYASSKYGEDTETIRAHAPESVIVTFEAMAKQCEVLANRFTALLNVRVAEIDSHNTYSIRYVEALEITSLLEHDCPRCFRSIPNEVSRGQYAGALSRIDNETEICSDCGNFEASVDYEQVIAHR
jgi:hypothetical protein